jgi:hypothetical protein
MDYKLMALEIIQIVREQQGYESAAFSDILVYLQNHFPIQPEAQKDVRELVAQIRDNEAEYVHEDSKINIDWTLGDKDAAALIESSFQARLASARDQGEEPRTEKLISDAMSFVAWMHRRAQLANEDEQENVSDVLYKRLKAWKPNARAEQAERKCEEMRTAAQLALDLLNRAAKDGGDGGEHSTGCIFACHDEDCETCLPQRAEKALRAALATPAEGTTQEGE